MERDGSGKVETSVAIAPEMETRGCEEGEITLVWPQKTEEITQGRQVGDQNPYSPHQQGQVKREEPQWERA